MKQDKSIANALPGARKALRRAAAGESLSESAFDVMDLRVIEGFLKLKRGTLTAYAPRTQRRYLSAITRGTTAPLQSTNEYQRRKTLAFSKWHMTPYQYRKFAPLRNQIIESGVDIDDMLDPEPVRDIVDNYGFDYVIKVLTDQVDSIRSYTTGNKEPGNRRWHNRGTLEEDARSRMKTAFGAYYASGTDPYYYYHGSLK